MYMRDVRKPLELSEGELGVLIGNLERITGATFNDAFGDQINNFIGIIRETYLIEDHAITNKEIKRQLTQLRNVLKKAITLQEDMLSDHAGMMHISAMPGGMEEYINAWNAVEELLAANDTAIENVNERARAKEFKFLQVQQAMATELARELASFGVKITAYRDGIFAQCVREFLIAFNGEANGNAFRVYVPDDLFTIIQTAKDNHTSPERFFLLNIR